MMLGDKEKAAKWTGRKDEEGGEAGEGGTVNGGGWESSFLVSNVTRWC